MLHFHENTSISPIDWKLFPARRFRSFWIEHKETKHVNGTFLSERHVPGTYLPTCWDKRLHSEIDRLRRERYWKIPNIPSGTPALYQAPKIAQFCRSSHPMACRIPSNSSEERIASMRHWLYQLAKLYHYLFRESELLTFIVDHNTIVIYSDPNRLSFTNR